jgi:hypothetical protein
MGDDVHREPRRVNVLGDVVADNSLKWVLDGQAGTIHAVLPHPGELTPSELRVLGLLPGVWPCAVSGLDRYSNVAFDYR